MALVFSRSRRPKLVHTARGLTREVLVHDDGFVTVRVRGLAWTAMNERRREGRAQEVAFNLVGIRGGHFRPARWWRPGVLVLQVPGAGDPWRRRTDRQRKNDTYPKTRPHRLRFTPRQQPAFERLAAEIGLEDQP
jgi:hypothetical protein